MSQEQAIATYSELDLGYVDEDWRIEDLSTADWALQRLGECQEEIRQNGMVEAAAIARLKARTALLNERAERGARFFRSHLEAYTLANRDALLGGGKKKSRALLHGSLGFRKAGGQLEVKDREALLNWARKHSAELCLVRIKEEPALDEIKRHFKTKGEVPDGCEVSEEVEEVVVKPMLVEDSE